MTFAQSAGNSGLSFLKFGFGARNIAMGDAGNAVSDDLTALFYNPAKLKAGTGSEILLMHNEWIQDVSSEVLGVKSDLFGLPVALGFNVTTVRDIEVRSKPGPAESTFDANYFFGSISTGFRVYKQMYFGISGKYLYEGLFTDEATGFGFDFGALYSEAFEGLDLSAVVKNLGSMNKLRSSETELPTEFRVGASYRVQKAMKDFDFIIAAEYQKYTSSDDSHLNFGGEIFYDNLFAIRAGYQTGYESRSFTGGIGLKWGMLKFDYAFLPFALGLGNANLFSLQLHF
ncbi:MAG: hypothetical protein Kow0098_28660 [Ignavibacteriaceae bacterium]